MIATTASSVANSATSPSNNNNNNKTSTTKTLSDSNGSNNSAQSETEDAFEAILSKLTALGSEIDQELSNSNNNNTNSVASKSPLLTNDSNNNNNNSNSNSSPSSKSLGPNSPYHHNSSSETMRNTGSLQGPHETTHYFQQQQQPLPQSQSQFHPPHHQYQHPAHLHHHSNQIPDSHGPASGDSYLQFHYLNNHHHYPNGHGLDIVTNHDSAVPIPNHLELGSSTVINGATSTVSNSSVGGSGGSGSLRTDSPDNDSAFSDSISLISSEQSSSSSSSSSAANAGAPVTSNSVTSSSSGQSSHSSPPDGALQQSSSALSAVVNNLAKNVGLIDVGPSLAVSGAGISPSTSSSCSDTITIAAGTGPGSQHNNNSNNSASSIVGISQLFSHQSPNNQLLPPPPPSAQQTTPAPSQQQLFFERQSSHSSTGNSNLANKSNDPHTPTKNSNNNNNGQHKSDQLDDSNKEEDEESKRRIEEITNLIIESSNPLEIVLNVEREMGKQNDKVEIGGEWKKMTAKELDESSEDYDNGTNELEPNNSNSTVRLSDSNKNSNCDLEDGQVGGHHIDADYLEYFSKQAEPSIAANRDIIKNALEKIREANFRKLYLKVFAEDNSAKSLLADERMSIGAICRQLANKNHIPVDLSHCIMEHMPQLYLERFYEDHESLVENVLYWSRDTTNKLYFMQRTDKYDLFVHPEKYLAGNSGANGQSQQQQQDYDTLKYGSGSAAAASHLRGNLIEEFFSNCGSGRSIRVPEIEGNLYLRSEGKKVWKKYFFTLRSSGLYYGPKGKPKSTKDLICLTTFELNCVYCGFGWKKKFKAPNEFGFAIKHPQIQTKSPKQIKYLCAESEDELRQWLTGIRIAKYGRQLWDNFQQLKQSIHQQQQQQQSDGNGNDEIDSKIGSNSPDSFNQQQSNLSEYHLNGSGYPGEEQSHYHSHHNPHQQQQQHHTHHNSHQTHHLHHPSSVVMRQQHRVSSNDSIRSSCTSSSSGCMSEQSSLASTPSNGSGGALSSIIGNGGGGSGCHDSMNGSSSSYMSSPMHHHGHYQQQQQQGPGTNNAFDADFPLGTIKRKPSVSMIMQPRIPLTNTTRNLALQSDDALLEMDNEDNSGGHGSSSGGHSTGYNGSNGSEEETYSGIAYGEFQRGSFKTGTLRRSNTEERLKLSPSKMYHEHHHHQHYAGPKMMSPPPHSVPSPQHHVHLSQQSPLHHSHHHQQINQPIGPTQPINKNSDSEDDLPPPPSPLPGVTLKPTESNLSLNSFPPPPPDMLRTSPNPASVSPLVASPPNPDQLQSSSPLCSASMSNLSPQSPTLAVPPPLPIPSGQHHPHVPMTPQPQPKNAAHRLSRRLSDLSANSTMFLNYRHNNNQAVDLNPHGHHNQGPQSPLHHAASLGPNSRASIATTSDHSPFYGTYSGSATMKPYSSNSAKGGQSRFQRQLTLDLHSLSKYGTAPRVKYDSSSTSPFNGSEMTYGSRATVAQQSNYESQATANGNFYNGNSQHQSNGRFMPNNGVPAHTHPHHPQDIYGGSMYGPNPHNPISNSHCSLVNMDGLMGELGPSSPQRHLSSSVSHFNNNPHNNSHYSPSHISHQSPNGIPASQSFVGSSNVPQSQSGHYRTGSNHSAPSLPQAPPPPPPHMTTSTSASQVPKSKEENHYMSISPHLLHKHQQMQLHNKLSASTQGPAQFFIRDHFTNQSNIYGQHPQQHSQQQHSPNYGQYAPSNVPEQQFLKNMERVMQKKWQVAQMLRQESNPNTTPGQVMGFRDSAYLPPPPPPSHQDHQQQPQYHQQSPTSHYQPQHSMMMNGNGPSNGQLQGQGQQQIYSGYPSPVPNLQFNNNGPFNQPGPDSESIYSPQRSLTKSVRISDTGPTIINHNQSPVPPSPHHQSQYQQSQYPNQPQSPSPFSPNNKNQGSMRSKVPPPPPKRSDTTQLTGGVSGSPISLGTPVSSRRS